MNPIINLSVYLCVGFVGGYLGTRLRVPAGSLIGAMIAVILFKLLIRRTWEVPHSYGFVVQVLLGVMVGASFYPEMIKTISQLIVPVITSTIVLVLANLLLSMVFARLGLLEITTAYLSTSPGAMSAIIGLASDTHSSLSVVTSFHFFRILFIILTAPLIFRYLAG
jgi:membrane AbrB-like protein